MEQIQVLPLETADLSSAGYDLYFTRRLEIQDDSPASLEAVQASHRFLVTTGLPFFLDKAGKYEHQLNAFFRELATDGCHSPFTWKAYARDISAYIRFLDQVYGTHWINATKEQVTHYRAVRRGPDAELFGAKLSGRSWNRALCAIDRLYRYALEEQWIDVTPFKFKYSSPSRNNRRSAAIRTNVLRDPENGEIIVKCISLEDYRIFREVGLRGLLPCGNPDPKFTGRHATRNVLFADLITETGLRVTEAAALLTWELPHLYTRDGGGKSLKMDIASGIAKGRKSRPVRVNIQLLRRIHDYVEIERDNCLQNISLREGHDFWSTQDVVIRTSESKYRMVGNANVQSVNEATFDRRRTLVERQGDGNAQPVGLWMSDRGSMLSQESWRGIFKDACARCAAFGFPMEVTPHTLRHTFAVHMLQRLIETMISKTDIAQLKADVDAAKYRRLIADPLRILQRMLGHSSLETTYQYLTHLDEAVEIADLALDLWQIDLAAEIS